VPHEGEYLLVGRTRDDAAGEAYDKVAKLLGLGYPGGPIIDRLAKQGNEQAIDFPSFRITHRDRSAAPEAHRPPGFEHALRHRADFSFSGLKTAVMRHVTRRQAELAQPGGSGTPGLPPGEIADICASFQRAVVDALLGRTFEAASWFDARSVGIAGGVSANSRLRAEAVARGERVGLPVFVPAVALSTDNAAMIAAAGLRRLSQGVTATVDLNADASLPIGPHPPAWSERSVG
jgi:N6-L-threonylcarbamoyladenine synthase